MIDIQKLDLEQKRQLLAMLQASLGEKIDDTEAEPKLTPEQIEAQKCNMFAKYMRAQHGKIGQLKEFDVVVKRRQKIAYER